MKVLVLLAALQCVLCSAAAASAPFTIHLSMQGEYDIGADVSCSVLIHNPNDHDYYLLRRNTPLEGIMSPSFSVSKEGRRLPYEGLLFKRGPPSREEYVLIPGRSNLRADVDLSHAYGFESVGTYIVRLETTLKYFAGISITNSTVQPVSSNRVKFALVDSGKQPRPTKARILRSNSTKTTFPALQSPKFSGGSSSSFASLRTPRYAGTHTSSDTRTASSAYSAAYNILYKSSQEATSTSSLYREWFGNPYYRQTVKGAYLSIKSAIEQYTYTLYFHGPDCEANVFAYTYHGSRVIYFCDAYFHAPITGSDSKMGTIVHEMSHAVAYTDDIAYGKQDCKDLARYDPSSAIKNADNYEYFSEALQ